MLDVGANKELRLEFTVTPAFNKMCSDGSLVAGKLEYFWQGLNVHDTS